MTRLLSIALLTLALGACTTTRTPVYDCPLDDVQGAKCASMEDAYRASRTMVKQPGQTRVQSVFDRRVQGDAQSGTDRPMFEGKESGYPDTNPGRPVFNQPQVKRVWIAPYVDADGNLRSGEYLYFSTPGQWNYGTLRKPGAAASGTFGPGRPDALGFTPDLSESASARPARPAEPTAAPAPAAAGSPSAPPSTRPSVPASQGDITQPYQRITN